MHFQVISHRILNLTNKSMKWENNNEKSFNYIIYL